MIILARNGSMSLKVKIQGFIKAQEDSKLIYVRLKGKSFQHTESIQCGNVIELLAQEIKFWNFQKSATYLHMENGQHQKPTVARLKIGRR
jgi:hypothetical protein